MAEDTTVAAEAPSTETNGKVIVVKRFVDEQNPDGKPFEFVPQKLKKRQKTDPDKYAYVPVKPKFSDEAEADRMLKHLGKELVLSLAYGRWRSMAAGWTESATKEVLAADGKTVESEEFNENEFIKYAAEFSARGETIKDLLAEKDELTGEIISLSQNTKMAVNDKMARMTEIGFRLNEITETIEFKKRSGKSENDEALAVAAV